MDIHHAYIVIISIQVSIALLQGVLFVNFVTYRSYRELNLSDTGKFTPTKSRIHVYTAIAVSPTTQSYESTEKNSICQIRALNAAIAQRHFQLVVS